MSERTDILPADPCDGWPWAWPANGYRMAADRVEPVCFEGFEPRQVTPVLAKFLPYVRTDFHHWSDDTDWTLESGPDEAPSSIDIVIPFTYRPGSGPSWTHPGDPPELEIGQPWFANDAGERCEVSPVQSEMERIETWIWENPPEPDYGDDW